MKRLILLVLLPFFIYPQTIQRSWIEYQQMAALITRDSTSIVMPEHWGITGSGINDSASTVSMFKNALGKVLVFTDSIYTFDKVIDIDCGGEDVTLYSPNNATIYSTAQNPEREYFAFWIGRDVGRPDVGAIYSTGGSEFLLVDTMVTENYLGQRISGSGAISENGVLTKVSGTGGSATYPYTTLITQDGRYYLPLGAINFRNANKLDIQGINFQFDNSEGFSRAGNAFFNGITLENCDNVVFRHNTISDALAWGIMVRKSNNIDISHNTVDSSLLGNIGIVACKGGVIGYNISTNSGNYAPVNGYGISLSHQSGTWENNENITVIGNIVNYNLRKGIDVHGGVNLNITKNSVKGFGDKGIGGHNTGDFEYGHLNEVVNLSITDNNIENDSVWYSTIPFGYGQPGYDEPYVIGITAGSYWWSKPAANTIGAGNIVISRNKIKNLTAYQGDTLVSVFPIRCFTGFANSALISDNTIDSSTVVHGISIGGGAPTLADGDIQVVDISGNIFRRVIAEGLGTSVAGRIIVVTGGKTININNNKMIDCSAFGGHGIYTVGVSPQVIDFVKINGNFIDGSEEIGLGAGIYIRSGRYDITNNTFSGRILTGQPITSFITTQGTIQGNSYINEDENEQPLPDYLSSTTGEFNISFAKDTSSAIDTITTMLVNPGGSYPYSINGSAGFWVTVEVSNSTEQSVYEYYAWATNDTTSQDTTVSKYTETKDEFSYSEEVEDLAEIKIGGKPVATEQDTTLYYVENVSFGIDTLTSTVINGSDDPLQLFWQNIGGASTPAGHLRRLEIYCDKPETIYKVKVKFLGYRLQPYYMTY